MAKYNMKAAFPIEAMQWKASFGVWDLTDWFLRAVTNGSIRRDPRAADQLLVDTVHAGTKIVQPGHWITMGLEGEFDTYPPGVFASMYEAVLDEPASPPAKALTDAQIKHMVDRFLGWRLPENFNPDCGISFKKTFNDHMPFGPQKHEPIGTNLFDAEQATAMVRYMVEGTASVAPSSAAPSPMQMFHDAWGYAKEHPEVHADGYDKQAFGYVQFWLDLIRGFRTAPGISGISGVQIEVIEANRPENDEIVLVHENFQQCDTCAAKPGSPTLCRGCIHNRVLIERLSRATKLNDEDTALVIHALILGKDRLLDRAMSDRAKEGGPLHALRNNWRKTADEMAQLHDRLVAERGQDVHDHD